jgi:hypothetical protein
MIRESRLTSKIPEGYFRQSLVRRVHLVGQASLPVIFVGWASLPVIFVGWASLPVIFIGGLYPVSVYRHSSRQ